MKEEWRDLVEPFWGEHFEVSNRGKIRSKDRTLMTGNRWGNRYEQFYPGKEMLIRTNNIEPHLFSSITRRDKNGDRFQKSAYIAKEVALAFIPRPKGPIARYKPIKGTPYFKRTDHYERYVENIDGVYTNCEVSNLRWMTGYELHLKQVKNGRIIKMDLYKHSPIWKKRKKTR